MSSHAEVDSWLANPEAALEKLAELAVTRRTILSLTKKADILADANKALQSGLASARPYADKAMAAAKPAVDWAKANPSMALPLGGAATGAALAGVGNLTGRKRKGSLMGDMVTGGLAGTAVGGGLAAINYANNMKPGAPGAAPPTTAGTPSAPATGVPAPAASAVDQKAQLEHLGRFTPGKALHDTSEGLAGAAARNPVTAMLLGAEASGSASGLANRMGKAPMVSSHVDDLSAALKSLQKDLPVALSSRLGTADQAKSMVGALSGLSNADRQKYLLEAVAGRNVNIPLPADAEKIRTGMQSSMDNASKSLGGYTKSIDSLGQNVAKGTYVNTQAQGLMDDITATRKMMQQIVADNPGADVRSLTGPMNKKLIDLLKRFRAVSQKPNPLDEISAAMASGKASIPGAEDAMKKMLEEAKKHQVPSNVTITPEQMGHITAKGAPFMGNQPDGLLHKALGVTLPNSGPRRLIDWLRGKAAVPDNKLPTRLNRMGYKIDAANNIVPGKYRLDPLRRGLSNAPRFLRGAPARMGLMAAPAIGAEGIRMYQEGAKQKADLAKFIESLKLEQQRGR